MSYIKYRYLLTEKMNGRMSPWVDEKWEIEVKVEQEEEERAEGGEGKEEKEKKK